MADIAKYERWADALDARFRIFGIPVGWDSILGLIPGVGDAITVVPAALMIHDGYKSGVRKRALARMMGNTALDLTFGSIPVLGDLFDATFKSHKRNVAVLKEELSRKEAERAKFAQSNGNNAVSDTSDEDHRGAA
ncbi:DUF4112 domain-containing protein [Yoonia litorea]|uniref:DUF4112 domain-containing protein n=1 Tax=Yoonia litorea TaxID=1123755 RepID=A0A1I6MZW8_9RHOB|nr:DUF4112 domain-containing protein [Yoonia litorea]SFS21239.1 protein of unknown function [Yoonia litorea]